MLLLALPVFVLSVLRHKLGAVAASAACITGLGIVQFGQQIHRRDTKLDDLTELRVLSLNLCRGKADPSALVQSVNQSADLVMVSELTPESVERLRDADIGAQFPHSLLLPLSKYGGVGIWSRYHIAEVSIVQNENNLLVAGRVHVPALLYQPVVASVHVMSPVAGMANTFERWNAGLTDTKARLEGLRNETLGTVVIAGDFNSTVDMRQFRDLLQQGYHDAAQHAGRGYLHTYCVHPRLPPVLAIDHILTRNAVVKSVRTEEIVGSDHRAVLATICIPADFTA